MFIVHARVIILMDLLVIIVLNSDLSLKLVEVKLKNRIGIN